MPRIKNIEKDGTITENDKLLGTDVSGETKNYLVKDLATFFKSSQFVFNQQNASASWGTDGIITHNLNKFPSVVIKFSSSPEYTNVSALGGVQYLDENRIKITLAAAESGFAYLN